MKVAKGWRLAGNERRIANRVLFLEGEKEKDYQNEKDVVNRRVPSTMPTHTTVLIDAERGFHSGNIEISPSTVGGRARGYRVSMRRLHGGLSEGVDLIEVDNGETSVTLIPTRGMGLWKARRGDLDIGWQSPVRGPVHPQFVPFSEPSGNGWLAGFDELLPRCGLESNGGADFDPKTGRLLYPLHGRIANLPACKVTVEIDGDSGAICVTGVVEEQRFHFAKLRLVAKLTTRVGERGFAIHDEIENLSESPAEAQMLYHVNFGAPLVDGGARIVVPVERVAPLDAAAAKGIATWDLYDPPTPGYEAQVFLLKLRADAAGRTQALLHDSGGGRGVSLGFNVRELPWFTVWKNLVPLADGYVTGIEPGTNFPNERTFEGSHGRVILLPGRGRAALSLGFTAHLSAAEVDAARQDIASIAGKKPPEVAQVPVTGWSPAA